MLRMLSRHCRAVSTASVLANSIDESTFNQIASKCEAQSKILKAFGLLDELAAHHQTSRGLGGHP
jgi:hypothetical protein